MTYDVNKVNFQNYMHLLCMQNHFPTQEWSKSSWLANQHCRRWVRWLGKILLANYFWTVSRRRL